MPTYIPVEKLYHSNIVVADARATARNYALLLGISKWRVVHHTPERLAGSRAFGASTPYGYLAATGSNNQGVTFRLIQPTTGLSTFQEFLLTRGPGVHSICVATVHQREFDELRPWLAQQGITVAQASSVDDVVTGYYLDTRAALGGYYVQLIVPRADDWQTRLGVDEEWDYSGEVEMPSGSEPMLGVPKVGHFGVAVNDITGLLPNYSRLLGIYKWRGSAFLPGPGGLRNATLNGRPVEQGFLQALSPVADFGIELLQSVHEPTHYKAEFIDKTGGPGIHHMLLLLGMDEALWPALRDAMASVDVGIAQSGEVRYGAGCYYYLETRARLGGYVSEVLMPRPDVQIPAGAPTMLSYELDFSPEAPQ
jgi:hypothetical protein